jgi:hypothetical protein
MYVLSSLMKENFFACIVFCPEKINFHKAKKTKQNFYAIFCFLLAMMHKEKRKSLVLGPKKVIRSEFSAFKNF